MSYFDNKNEKELKVQYKEKGIKEGLERAKKESYIKGFKDGVVRGIELGMLISFVNTTKKLLEKTPDNSKNEKILKMINNMKWNDYEELERKVNVLKANLLLLNKKNND